MKNSTKLYDKLFKTVMATAIATSAIAVVVPETTKARTDEEVFRDVKTASDYYQYVNELFERGFVSGYPDGSFKPTGLLTRAQASKILALNLGLNVTKTFNHTFNDIPQNDWAYPYVAALKEAGVIDGYPDGAFRPNAPITRSQMAKIIVNGYGLKPATEITFPFTDIATDDWAAPYIQALFDAGITIGQTATTYGGYATVTRANMAAFTIRSEVTTDYRDNRSPDENIISSIKDNKITIGGQEYYIKKELQPLLHERNLAVLNEANLDFIKIGTKIVGIRNVELLNGGTAEQPLVLDLAGGAVDTNITIAGDYIKIVNANVTGDITVKQGDQKLVEFNGLDLNGRLIIEGDTKHQQESVVKMTDTTVNEVIVNRDQTKIITDNSTPTIKIDSNVSQVEIAGKINAIDFIGKQDVLVKGTLETQELTIETPIKVTLENKVQLPSVETQQYGSQLIVPTDSTIGRLTKPSNVKPEEAVKLPEGGTPKIGMVTDKAEVERPTTPVTPPVTPPTTGGGSTGGSGGGTVTPSFVSQVTTANNIIDAENKDASAVGMVGTRVTTNNSNVATATIKDGKIHITSVGPGTATLIVKEDAPSTKEAQIFVVVDAYGKISYTIKRPETDSFVSETATANNIVDVENKDASAVGMVGTTVTTSNSNVATATIKDGKINITSVGPGTATITVKEDAPSEKEAQILVTVDANGKITQKIKRPVEVAQDKLTAEPTPATAELVEIYKAVDINGITLENVTDVTKAVKDAITAKGGSLTEEELKLVVDTALLPYLIKKDNESLEKVSTPLELITTGPNGTSFTWQSVEKIGNHNGDIDLATGNVTRDDADDNNDKVKLHVTATNGAATKAEEIDTTILEMKKPYLISATLQDNDGDGDTSTGDRIILKFSERVGITDNINMDGIDASLFGVDGIFGVTNEGSWSEDGTTLTMVVGTGATLKVNNDITLQAGKVIDKNGTESGTNTVQLQLAPYEYTIVTPNVTGEFYYDNSGKIVSEAAEQVPNTITFSRNGQPITDATVTYGDEDVATGTIASGLFTLKSINVTRNGKTEKVTFANGESISVNTAPVLNIISATEFTAGVNSSYVQNGYVKTVKVADTVAAPIIVSATQTLAHPVIIDGKDKLELTSGVAVTATKDEVQLKNLKVSGNQNGAQTALARGSIKLAGETKLTLDNVDVKGIDTGGFGFAGIILSKDNAQLAIKDSNIAVQYSQGGDNSMSAYGIRADGENANITVVNSTISSNSKAGDVGAYGIKGGEGTTVSITDGSVGVEANASYTRTVHGIHLGNSSNLTIEGTSTIKVVAPNANGFGVGNNDKYASQNVSTGTIFDIDGSANGKRKAPYEYDLDALNKINAALAQIDEALIKKANPSLQEVTTDLNLPTIMDDLAVTWSADTVNGATIAQDGTVTRSANDDIDDEVTLTATIIQNGMTKTKTFQVIIKENKVPTIVKVETVDSDSNGKLDGLKITLSESIKDSTVDVKDFVIAGYSNLGFNTGSTADDDEIYITFDEGEVFDTDQTPTLTYTEGTLSDVAGNLLGTDSKLSVDKANPILIAVSINDDLWSELGDIMTLTYSEKVIVDTSNNFKDRYTTDTTDGHQIYFPQVDAMLGLDNNSSNILKSTFEIVTYNSNEDAATVGSRITVPEIPNSLPSNILRIEVSHSSFRSGGVPNQSTIALKDLFISEITDLANNQLKHTSKTMTITKN